MNIENKYLFERINQIMRWRMYKRDQGRGDLKKYNKLWFISRVLYKPSNAIRATIIKGNSIFDRAILMGWSYYTFQDNILELITPH